VFVAIYNRTQHNFNETFDDDLIRKLTCRPFLVILAAAASMSLYFSHVVMSDV
jgi:hypothetical protein